MGREYQAANVKFPEFRAKNAFGENNTVSTVILYDATTSDQCHEVPEEFWGKYARLTVVGGELYFVFTDKSNHVVDRTVAATAAGTRAEGLAGIMFDGESREGIIPTPPKDGKIYFSREASASATVRMELASD